MKILISAYACEPSKGSEPGAGWNWACAAAHEHEVWLMTRANNRSALEAAIETDRPEDAGRLPGSAWMGADMEKGRPRTTLVLLPLATASRTREPPAAQDARIPNGSPPSFANLWLPALICVVDAPFFAWPRGWRASRPNAVAPCAWTSGHGSRVVSTRGSRVESSQSTCPIFVETRPPDPLPERGDPGCPAQAVSRQVNYPVERDCAISASRFGTKTQNRVSHGGYQAICAGRLQPWKGLALAIRAVAVAPGWRLLIIGEGPDRERLARLARKIGVESRVEIRSSCAQEELWDLLLSSDVLLLPSLREDASFIAAEAGALGVPIIAFDRGGPPVLQAAGLPAMDLIKLESVRGAVDGLAHALGSQAGRPWARERAVAVDFSPPATRKKLSSIYQRVVPG